MNTYMYIQLCTCSKITRRKWFKPLIFLDTQVISLSKSLDTWKLHCTVQGGSSKGEGGVGGQRLVVKQNDPKCVAASMIHSFAVYFAFICRQRCLFEILRKILQSIHLALIFRRVNNAIHQRTCYLLDSIVCLVKFYPLDKYLSSENVSHPF